MMNDTRRVFSFWTDDTPMSDERWTALKDMRQSFKNQGIEHILVKPETLHEWVVETHPLHASYQNLSAVHRAHYLQCYFMHFYGGGYSNIVVPRGSWAHAFQHIERDPGAYLVGARADPEAITDTPLPVGQAMKREWYRLPAMGGFVCRKGTGFTGTWLKQVEYTLNALQPQLEQHPATNPYDVFFAIQKDGSNSKYPMRNTQILGDILYPLCYAFALQLRLTLLI